MGSLSRFVSSLILLTAIVLSGTRLYGQIAETGDGGPGPFKIQHLTVEIVPHSAAVRPGNTTDVELAMTLDEGWHVYWLNAGDSGKAPQIRWTLPAGITAGPMRFPTPSRLPLGLLMDFGYEKSVAFPIAVASASTVIPGAVHLDAHVSWLVCREVCIPGRAHLGTELQISEAAPASRRSTFAQSVPVPYPSGMTSSAVADANEIILTLHTGRREESADVFPFDEDQIVNAAAPSSESLPDGIRIRLKRDPALTTLPQNFHVLVKFHRNETYDVSAPMIAGPGPAMKTGAAQTHTPTTAVLGAIGLAFLGGIVLNLMPCVFPVLFIKGLTLVQSSGEGRKHLRMHGLVYTAGIIASFWAIVAALLIVRAGGSQAGWGFQLQSPTFVAILAAGMLFFGLSLAGQFDLGLSVTSVGGGLATKNGLTGSFFTGVLATVVATPCTAPLMGAAIGFALVQPTAVTVAIFTALGLGLAAPYLLLTLQPSWTRWLPRPGAWMETLKQLTAVPIFATTIWLTWVYGRLFTSDTAQGADHMARLLWAYLVVVIAGWTLHKWPAKRASSLAASILLILAVAIPLSASKQQALAWKPYSSAALEDARHSGHPIFIDFTAAWCLSCQVNERVVLRSAEIEKQLRSHRFVLLRADWTQYDPEITKQLGAVGRAGVPTYVLYSGAAHNKVDVLPELLSKDIVLRAIQRDAD